jgi:hypothetical protein
MTVTRDPFEGSDIIPQTKQNPIEDELIENEKRQQKEKEERRLREEEEKSISR